jgi:hypothetical protein
LPKLGRVNGLGIADKSFNLVDSSLIIRQNKAHRDLDAKPINEQLKKKIPYSKDNQEY